MERGEFLVNRANWSIGPKAYVASQPDARVVARLHWLEARRASSCDNGDGILLRSSKYFCQQGPMADLAPGPRSR